MTVMAKRKKSTPSKRIRDPEAFAARVRAELERRDMTVYQLAQQLAISRAYLYDIMRGEKSPGWATACQIADALDVALDDLC